MRCAHRKNLGCCVALILPSRMRTSATATMPISMKVTGITNSNQITVHFNNTNVTNFSFNAGTGVISFNVNLISGTNTILVNATNNIATGSQTIIVTYGTGNKTNGDGNNPKNGTPKNDGSSKTTTNPKNTTTTTTPTKTTTTTTTPTKTTTTTNNTETTTTTKTDSTKTTTVPTKTITKPK